MEQIKSKWVNGFIIGTFVSLYLLVSIISTIHVIDFFELSNPRWLAISLAIGFELGAAASLAAIITLDKMNKTLVWALFLVITAMQMQGNMYYAFINMGDFTTWSELFNLIEEEPLYQKRVLSFVSGAILPLVALGFIKSLVDYIKPVDDSPLLDESSSEKKTEVDSSRKSEDTIEKKVEDMDIQDFEEDTDHQEELDRASEKGDIKFQESRLDLLEKQPQTNIPANGLINRTVETSSVTLDGTKQNIQRKIKEVKKVNN
jgi:hypothetical protein